MSRWVDGGFAVVLVQGCRCRGAGAVVAVLWLPIHQVPVGQSADQLLSIGWHTCTEIPLQIQSRRPKKAQGTRWALLKISQWQDAPQVQDGKLIERKNNEKTRQNAASPPVSKFASKGYTENQCFHASPFLIIKSPQTKFHLILSSECGSGAKNQPF